MRAFSPVILATREWSGLLDTLIMLATALLDERAIMTITVKKRRWKILTVKSFNHYQCADILLAKRWNYVRYIPHS